MGTFSVCMFCGSDSKSGDHTYCRDQLRTMAFDMQKMEPWMVMQRAEAGYYGKAPHSAKVDPTNWAPRADELRKQGKKWRVIAEILNREGFRSKHGHELDSALILNNLHNKIVKKGST